MKQLLSQMVEHEKALRTKFIVREKDGDCYKLYTPSEPARRLTLNLYFYHLDRLPERHDALYFSENLFGGLRERLYSYQFSAKFGWPSAREPHDFLLDPREFLIVEYADGETMILEEQYG